MTIWTAAFWKAASERALKSFVQGLLVAGIGAAGFNVFAADVDWRGIFGLAFGMALVSLLTSIGSDALTGEGPSLTNAEVVPDEEP